MSSPTTTPVETPAVLTVRSSLAPGDLGRLIALHGEVYAQDGPLEAFGPRFEAYVARTVAEFVLDAGAEGRLFLAERGGVLVASAALVERARGADRLGQLRWVAARPKERGAGLGRQLVQAALDHARAIGLRTVYLETTEGLIAARRLYESLGFVEFERRRERLWSGDDLVIAMRLEFAHA